MKIITYTCTIIPTLIWGLLMDSNIDENIIAIIIKAITIISFTGVITASIILKSEFKMKIMLSLIYNIIITFVLIGGLLYSGEITVQGFQHSFHRFDYYRYRLLLDLGR